MFIKRMYIVDDFTQNIFLVLALTRIQPDVACLKSVCYKPAHSPPPPYREISSFSFISPRTPIKEYNLRVFNTM